MSLSLLSITSTVLLVSFWFSTLSFILHNLCKSYWYKQYGYIVSWQIKQISLDRCLYLTFSRSISSNSLLVSFWLSRPSVFFFGNPWKSHPAVVLVSHLMMGPILQLWMSTSYLMLFTSSILEFPETTTVEWICLGNNTNISSAYSKI